MTLLYADPIFLEHQTGRHPECPDRLRAISRRLDATGLLEKCTLAGPKLLDVQSLYALHDEQVIRQVEEVNALGGGLLDADTVMSARSFEVALAAAGTCVAAVDAVVAGPDTRALCLIRPPGHHATPGRSMGFCLFNNIALAAHHARTTLGLSRIMILDWDVHHGNGTQDIFYGDSDVYVLNIHRYGNGFYPGTGAADETGTGAGLGFNRNVTIRHGTSRTDYLKAARSNIEEVASSFKPELLLISAGFDAHKDDPIGSLGLEVEDFAALTDHALEVARTHTQGRVVSCLEGGYNLNALAECVEAHLACLLNHSHK